MSEHTQASPSAPLRVISYGGGVQSTALLVLAVQGKLGKVDAALFSNVGDDSENPETLRYIKDYAVPLGHAGGVPVVIVERVRRNGQRETLRQRLRLASQNHSVENYVIPLRGDDGAPLFRRNCTVDFKVRVVERWLRQRGASRGHKAITMIGFSFDEAIRVGNGGGSRISTPEYPLIEKRLTRDDCARIILRAGLPLPPKSSCYFCPYKRPSEWRRMREQTPELFEQAAVIEDEMNTLRVAKGRGLVWLTKFNGPLRDVIDTSQQHLDFGTGPGETCDEGYCWT